VAMTAVLAEVSDTSAEEFKRVTEVTYLGSVHGVQTALRRMLPRDRGVIVQVGSALSRRGIPLQATYCASKHAIKGFCDSLRAELLHNRSSVRIALVQLPGLNTPQFGWVRTRLHKHPQPVARLVLHPAADELLAAAGIPKVRRHRVRLGNIEEVHPRLVGAIEDGVAGGLVRLIAERHGAQADLGYGEAGPAQAALLHASPNRWSADPIRAGAVIQGRDPVAEAFDMRYRRSAAGRGG